MGVSLYYFLALIPIGIGAVCWYYDNEVVWWEWLTGSAFAVALAVTFHIVAINGMTKDEETWSGQIERAVHYPLWREEYQEMHTRTVGSGKNTHTEVYFTTEHRWHAEHWTAYTQYTSHEITGDFFTEIGNNFGGVVTENGHKGGFCGGDPNIYVAYDKTGYVYPTTSLHRWSNRVKAAPSVFTFAKVPTNAAVFPWPENSDWTRSDRLLGTAQVLFDQREFDCMNSRLGPVKKVNVIFVGFENKSSDYGQYQEAAWLGGKKNDLVVSFSGMSHKHPAKWCHVFGWSESFLAKRNIETLFTSHPASPQLLKQVEQEIRIRYKIKDWSKFDYITVDPPMWSYPVFFLALILTQSGLYVFFHRNEYGRRNPRRRAPSFY